MLMLQLGNMYPLISNYQWAWIIDKIQSLAANLWCWKKFNFHCNIFVHHQHHCTGVPRHLVGPVKLLRAFRASAKIVFHCHRPIQPPLLGNSQSVLSFILQIQLFQTFFSITIWQRHFVESYAGKCVMISNLSLPSPLSLLSLVLYVTKFHQFQ